MSWVDKLFEKICFSIEDKGRMDYLYVNDLVLAVLEKNKEITDEIFEIAPADLHFNIIKNELQARAFRELVEAVQKRVVE